MLAAKRGRSARGARPSRRIAAVLAGVLGMGILAACGGGGGTTASSDTLTVALPGFTPDNFDLPTVYSSPIFEVAYEPLIRVSATGEYEPGIAESWEYSENNTVFTMKIREGVKFSDGTDVTVQAVVDSLKYYKSVPGLYAGFLEPWTIEAAGDDSVRISYKEPFRGMEYVLASDGNGTSGMIISNAGLANPEKMKTDMFGAGPYDYVPDESEPGDHYTFKPNPNYYDKSRQHWKKIVFRVIGDPNTAFNALVTGQVQVDYTGGQTVMPQAESKGFDVTESMTWATSIMIWDRKGEVSKPLGDVRVRQAMALALDRDSIAKASGPGSKPLDQFAIPDKLGADPDLSSKYTYDVDRAEQLMADAGYADGFSVTMLTNSDDPASTTAVAAAVEQLAAIDVKVKLKASPDSTFYSDLASRKYALGAVSWGLGGDVVWDADRLYKLPYSAVWNPFASTDPELDEAYQALATSDDATLEENATKFNEVMTEKTWFIPISHTPNYVFSKGIDIGSAGPVGEFDVASWKPQD